MRIGRWLGLVAMAPGFVVVLGALFLAGDLVGLKDTPAFRAAFVATAGVSRPDRLVVGRWKPVPHAAWSLPVVPVSP